MQLDWEKLRLFHCVAEAGSFTEAARRLHMSQPALSRQILALEASLGAKLFHRHARGLAMTHEGEQLYRATHEMHERIDRTQQNIEFLARPADRRASGHHDASASARPGSRARCGTSSSFIPISR